MEYKAVQIHHQHLIFSTTISGKLEGTSKDQTHKVCFSVRLCLFCVCARDKYDLFIGCGCLTLDNVNVSASIRSILMAVHGIYHLRVLHVMCHVYMCM